jgi:hypothetical protein
MTLIELQQDLVERCDRAIASLRSTITTAGHVPVAVLVPLSPGDGIEGALRRRKLVNAALCRQFSNLTQGAKR